MRLSEQKLALTKSVSAAPIVQPDEFSALTTSNGSRLSEVASNFS
jgi:hypothetical protein